jgi:hypothetical protein
MIVQQRYLHTGPQHRCRHLRLDRRDLQPVPVKFHLLGASRIDFRALPPEISPVSGGRSSRRGLPDQLSRYISGLLTDIYEKVVP